MKTFTAYFRYRDNQNRLQDTYVSIKALSHKDAKITAKNMEGQDYKTWLIEVSKGV